jgi:hypothetical protein
MNDKGTKRARTQQNGAGSDSLGREQLLLTRPELQTRLGRKFVDESELLNLLLAHGFLRRVRTIEIQVRPLGGDSFKITLDASKPTVGEAKAEIARVQGAAEARQELYKVAERADGLVVREDDAEPDLLEDENMILGDKEVVAMAVKELLLVWRTFNDAWVTLSEGGAVATQTVDEQDEAYDEDAGRDQPDSNTTTGIELTEGKHYFEVEILSGSTSLLFVGVNKPNLNPGWENLTEDWCVHVDDGHLYGNDRNPMDGEPSAGCYDLGDRVGVLLDLDDGSLRFFKNGVQHGPGFPAGSVTGPVVLAVAMSHKDQSVRLLPNAEAPVGN